MSGGHTKGPVAWLRDAHESVGDECFVPAAQGDPGSFPVYAHPLSDDLLDALLLILPLAKGYSPEGQTATARATCNSWIEAAESAISRATGETGK